MKLSKFNSKVAAAFILPAALMFASCSDNNEQTPNTESQIELVPITISADVLQPVSKIAFTGGANNGNLSETNEALEWGKGDKISVNFVRNGNSRELQIFTVTEVKDGNATLSGMGPKSDTYDVFAVYPAVEENADWESIEVSIANEQTQVGNNLKIDGNALMWGKAENVNFTDNEIINLEFTPKTALLRFNILNNTNEAITITNVKFQYDGWGNLYNTGTLNMNTGAIVPDQTKTPPVYSVDISGDPIAVGATLDAYMAILPTQTMSSGNYWMMVTYNNGETVKSILAASEIGDGEYAAGERYIFLVDNENKDGNEAEDDKFEPSNDRGPMAHVYLRGTYTLADDTQYEVIRVRSLHGHKDLYMSTHLAGLGENDADDEDLLARTLSDNTVVIYTSSGEVIKKACTGDWTYKGYDQIERTIPDDGLNRREISVYFEPRAEYRSFHHVANNEFVDDWDYVGVNYLRDSGSLWRYYMVAPAAWRPETIILNYSMDASMLLPVRCILNID